MPRRTAKIISALAKKASPKQGKTKRRSLVRRMAQGTLLAMALASSQFDDEAFGEKRRLFDSGLLDRLRPPLTRYHE